MTEEQKHKRRYQILIQQLDVIVFFYDELGLSKKEREAAIDRILDEMLEIRRFLSKN